MAAYYNELDANAAAWIRELIKEGVITDGEVDERSIEDVLPADVAGFDRVHWFAGIGVWDYALNLARWPDDRRVWTGSCPCQPFSAAGKGEGFADERHLWPALFHHILVGRPDAFFGEQVASKDGLTWLDLVSSDLEGLAYTTAAADIPVAGFGGPHRRQRLFFVADSTNSRREPITQPFAGSDREGMEPPESGIESRNVCSSPNVLADASGNGYGINNRSGKDRGSSAASIGKEQRENGQRLRSESGRSGEIYPLGENPVSIGRGRRCDGSEAGNVGQVQVEGLGTSGRSLANANSQRCEEQCERFANGSEQFGVELPSITNGFWHDAEWIYCRDEKYRPTKPGIFPLVNGATGRVALLRGAGNAISPEPAKAFIESYLEIKL